MRKILLGLFIVITLVANASIPGVNDSIFVEPKEDAAYYDMFLKSLPDSVYESPMVTRFFREVGDLGNIKISLIEHYSLNGKNKNHYLKFDISDAISSIGVSMSCDDVKSIITILTDIYENTRKLRLSGEKENISYKKLISSRSLFAVSLSYNPKKDSWNCQIDISIVDPANYVGKSVIIYQDVDYKKNYRLKDFEKDMSKLIELLKQGLAEITYRKYNYKEPILRSEKKGDYIRHYIDWGNNVINSTKDINLIPWYSEILFKEHYTEDINDKINGIINDYNKRLKNEELYGGIEVIVNASGRVIDAKLLLKELVSMTLDDKAVAKLLHRILKYKFKSFNEDDLPGVNLIKVYIPLKGIPYYPRD